MRQQRRRQFPFAGVGLLLIIVSAVPTVAGMMRGFYQLQRGEDATTTVSSGVAWSLHPAMIVCCNFGVLLLIIGIVRSLRRGGRTNVA